MWPIWETYEVWISREEIVDFLLYAASLEASDATRSKMSDKRVSTLQIGSGCDSDVHTVDERVQDGHGAVGDTSVRMDLLEDWSEQLVNVW
jgi:hypothetical protein